MPPLHNFHVVHNSRIQRSLARLTLEEKKLNVSIFGVTVLQRQLKVIKKYGCAEMTVFYKRGPPVNRAVRTTELDSEV